ncbi:transglutaminase-like domain-containing protein [Helicobacter mustelae]|uniref:transglutaminase-like domain-containing protein n=1 Tax=Helicobacter mustelae TaxID=217 RepID=UPI0013050FD7|nr:transglutaminase-like domain-containing protein [Helicobacter mustelae]
MLKPSFSTKTFQWSFPIIDTEQIHPLQFSVKKKFYKVYLKNKRVFFSIFDVKKGENLEISISYKTSNAEKFLQRQAIAIPSLQKKFQAFIQVEIDKNWEVFSYHPDFFFQNQKYGFYGIIDKKNFLDYFWISLKSADWKISLKHFLHSPQEIRDINILIPKYFKDSNLKIKKDTLETNLSSAQIIQKVNNTSIVFRGKKSQDFMVGLDAIVNNSIDAATYKNLNPNNFPTKSNPSLKNLAQEIISKSPNLPPYLAIAKWVHENIKYDEKMINKHLGSSQILQVKCGVCEHYAQLYGDIMQAIDVPSVMITGVGFNPFKKKFEYHAWNIVFIEGRWISMDTTWGIFSGKLPISHIFFYLGYQPLMMYETYDVPIHQIHTEVIYDIQLLQ